MCGEHPEALAAVGWAGRFIPTCVGNIHPAGAPGLVTAVHPHVCGEHTVIVGDAHQYLRFIPTRVGNISIRPLSALLCPPLATGGFSILIGSGLTRVFSLAQSGVWLYAWRN